MSNPGSKEFIKKAANMKTDIIKRFEELFINQTKEVQEGILAHFEEIKK